MVAETLCEICHGLGLIKTGKGSAPCNCQAAQDLRIRLRKAGFPAGYEAANLENMQSTPGNMQAMLLARRYVEEFMPGRPQEARRGILLVGDVGTGKTHLGSAVMRFLIVSKGIAGKFVDCRKLYDRLRATYDDGTRETQAGVLEELTSADLVMLDDLGSVRPSEWVTELTELLIGTLYNQRTAVIVTTNFPNLSPGEGTSTYEQLRPRTLGDRIGARMWSRLQQMCVAIQLSGSDWRLMIRIFLTFSVCLSFVVPNFVLDDLLSCARL